MPIFFYNLTFLWLLLKCIIPHLLAQPAGDSLTVCLGCLSKTKMIPYLTTMPFGTTCFPRVSGKELRVQVYLFSDTLQNRRRDFIFLGRKSPCTLQTPQQRSRTQSCTSRPFSQ